MEPAPEPDAGPSHEQVQRHTSRRSVGVTLVAVTLVLAAAWQFGWFGAPLQGIGHDAWADTWETETESTYLIGWFLPPPSNGITLTDAWLEGTGGASSMELVSVRAVRSSDEHAQIGSMSADDPELDRYQFRPLSGTVLEPTSDTVNDWYVVFEVRWSPRHADDFTVAGPMRLSYRDGLRRLEYRECGFIIIKTPQATTGVDETADAAQTECTGR